jgi:nucleoside-diphosphate-sugar epimerase
VSGGERVLVTGATGFLGRQVVEALLRAGSHPIVLVRDERAWSRDGDAPSSAVTVITGSPLDPPSKSDPRLTGLRAIVHTAAVVKHSRTVPDDLYPLNVDGTASMVRLAGELKARMIFVSTSGTVGCFHDPRGQADEDAPYATALVGRWPYYASKIKAEQKAREIASKTSVDLVVVRPPVLLGPGDSRFRSTKHVLSVMKQHVPLVPGGGMHFTDVRDVADALARLVAMPTTRPVYHLPGTATTLAEFFQMVHEVSGAPLPTRTMPDWALRSATRTVNRIAGGLGLRVPSWIPDPVVAEMASVHWGLSTLWSHKQLGYAPRAPRQTLVDTVAYLRAHHPDLAQPRAA